MKSKLLFLALCALTMVFVACDPQNQNPPDPDKDSPIAGNGGFSVAVGKQVKFAPGNLQYQASTNTWRFAPNQYDVIGVDNSNISDTYSGWIDLFGWGTADAPVKSSAQSDDYPTFVDWGTNAIQNGSATDAPNTWRTLTSDEWTYLFSTRPDAKLLYGLAMVNKMPGLVVIPDSTQVPAAFKSGTGSYSQNIYSEAEWSELEAVGFVFLPAAGARYGTGADIVGDGGYYWSGTPGGADSACFLTFFQSFLSTQSTYGRYYGFSVRLAREL